MNIPVGFRGTIQVETNAHVYALALRMEGSQFSTIQVSPFRSIYDFTINLTDGRVFRGEMTFGIGGGAVDGNIEFTNPPTDQSTSLSGPGVAGSFLASCVVLFSSTQGAMVAFSGSPIRTYVDNINELVLWAENNRTLSGGQFTAIRRK
jgi:hypothetical protein